MCINYLYFVFGYFSDGIGLVEFEHHLLLLLMSIQFDLFEFLFAILELLLKLVVLVLQFGVLLVAVFDGVVECCNLLLDDLLGRFEDDVLLLERVHLPHDLLDLHFNEVHFLHLFKFL